MLSLFLVLSLRRLGVGDMLLLFAQEIEDSTGTSENGGSLLDIFNSMVVVDLLSLVLLIVS